MIGWRYRPELDGLRSIAVYLVLLFHCQLSAVKGGFIGVDLFFVLSGFLVTHTILAEADKRDGSFGLGWFYSRRVRRLLPAALLVIVVTALVQLVVANAALRDAWIRDGQASLLYVANWQFILSTNDYFAADHVAGSPYLHFWSLSVEEQFYIFLPLLLLLALRRGWTRSVLPWVVGALLVASVVWQVVAATNDPGYAYYATQTRIYQPLAGVLLALATRRGTPSPQQVRLGGPAAAVGIVVLLMLASTWVDLSASWRGLGAAAISVLIIGGLYAAPAAWASRVLALPIPRYLGQISYGTYLWHWPVILLLQRVLDTRPIVTAAFAAVLATSLAALSHQVVESPVRKAPRLQPWGWTVVGVGLALSLMTALLVLPAVLGYPRKPALVAAQPSQLLMAEQLPWLSQRVPPGLDLAAAAADVPEEGPLCTEAVPQACRVVRGSGERWLLLGDSQAQMMLTAFEHLATEHDLTLYASIVRGCPWQQGLRHLGHTPQDAADCRTAREDFYQSVLPKLGIDRVVVVTLSRTGRRWQRLLSDTDSPSSTPVAQLQWEAGRRTVALLRATGAKVTFVNSTVGTAGFRRSGPDPLECLGRARTLGECAVLIPTERPIVDDYYRRWARDPGVRVVDLNPVICPGGPICRPVLEGVVVWKDPDHVTGTVLDRRRASIWEAFDRAGATPG